MNAKARTARQTLRQRAIDFRAPRKAARAAVSATRKARRKVAAGTPQTARTHLLAVGIAPDIAKRFAGAFSTRVQPTATARAAVALKGRVRKSIVVKLYDLAAFAARLAVYRPKDRAAAARFEQAAHRLAA
ncbi:hypothetical protein [Streptomyces goshikiensis]|uniref:hypothetical protein n=1 Tax=Streptomyces goshikiensis TaxID=1942 RepID=UPI0036A5F629